MKTVFVMSLNIDPVREPGVTKPSEVMLYVGVACAAHGRNRWRGRAEPIERDALDNG